MNKIDFGISENGHFSKFDDLKMERKKEYLKLFVNMYKKELIDCINLDHNEKDDTERDRASKGNTVSRCPLSKKWFVTFWTDDISVTTLLSIFKRNDTSGCICTEYCPETGREHIHLYIIFCERFRFTEYMNRFGYKKFKSFVSGKNGTKRAMEYCRKEGNYQSWGSDLEFPLYKVGCNVIPLKNM